MKKFYEESYKTLIFISRVEFFLLSANLDDEIESKLQDRIEQIIHHNKLWSTQNSGFIGPRYGTGKYSLFTPIFAKLGFSRMCPIFRIPGCYAADNANPCKVYQKWCEAFDGQLSDEEKQIIINAAYKHDDNFSCYVPETWNNMKEQKNWTWIKEIKSIVLFWKKKLQLL